MFNNSNFTWCNNKFQKQTQQKNTYSGRGGATLGPKSKAHSIWTVKIAAFWTPWQRWVTVPVDQGYSLEFDVEPKSQNNKAQREDDTNAPSPRP